MLTQSQINERRKGLGGTDIASILGFNPYKTCHEVYLEKTSESPIETPINEAMRWGNLLEQGIAKGYEEITGNKIITCEKFIHPDFPFFFSHPDRLIEGQNKGLEIKNVGINQSHLWGPSGSQQVPIQYYLQIAHYMFVTGFKEWDLAALIGGNTLRVYSFVENDSITTLIKEEGNKFWNEYVKKKTPPPFKFNPEVHSKKFLLRYYSTIEEEEFSLSEDLLILKEDYINHKKLEKEHKDAADIIKTHIMEAMGNSNRGNFSDGSYFVRKLIKVNKYTVPEKEIIRFNYFCPSIYLETHTEEHDHEYVNTTIQR